MEFRHHAGHFKHTLTFPLRVVGACPALQEVMLLRKKQLTDLFQILMREVVFASKIVLRETWHFAYVAVFMTNLLLHVEWTEKSAFVKN